MIKIIVDKIPKEAKECPFAEFVALTSTHRESCGVAVPYIATQSEQPKCFEHYVKREYIVTRGCNTQSAALREHIKQFCDAGTVCGRQRASYPFKPLINIGEGVIYGSICAGLPL